MILTEEQKALIQGLKEYGVEKEAIVGIMVALKEPIHTEAMIDYLLEHKEATQSDILSAMAYITQATM